MSKLSLFLMEEAFLKQKHLYLDQGKEWVRKHVYLPKYTRRCTRTFIAVLFIIANN